MIISSIKAIREAAVSLIYKWINTFTFNFFQVQYRPDFKINGKIFVRNNGKIIIGKSFKANSGKNNNPIGGDIILRLITTKNGRIEIGNNVGISNSTLYSDCGIFIEDGVMIGGGCRIWDSDFHQMDPKQRLFGNLENVKKAEIIIKNKAFVGGGSIILKGVSIGKNSIVAAGSVVTKPIPDNEVWGGNPAKKIKKLPY